MSPVPKTSIEEESVYNELDADQQAKLIDRREREEPYLTREFVNPRPVNRRVRLRRLKVAPILRGIVERFTTVMTCAKSID